MTRTNLWTLALACTLLASVSLAQDVRAEAGASGLHILLTNDDGIEAVGLQTLKTALRDAGHRVTVLAPNRNYSGSSASVGFGPVAVEEVGPGEYAADASPATCALLGLTAWADPERPFDLLVSGTNLGANAGPATGISGTVGATTIAASGMAGAVPAIAFSSTPPGDLAEAAAADPETHRRHFRNVAEFAVRLIDRLAERRDPAGALLAPGLRLNVNYPSLEPRAVAGVKIAVQGRGTPFAIVFEEKRPGLFAPGFAAAESARTPDVPDSDAAGLAEGYVTIVPLDTDYTAPAGALSETRRRLEGLAAQVPE
ncbi:MAG: hypothetical protein J4G09_08180 [Proteobacteria bacterium]|nr:hypothetical protein [Pseudomonadota bacterium]